VTDALPKLLLDLIDKLELMVPNPSADREPEVANPPVVDKEIPIPSALRTLRVDPIATSLSKDMAGR
jgi:hypothetical protein